MMGCHLIALKALAALRRLLDDRIVHERDLHDLRALD